MGGFEGGGFQLDKEVRVWQEQGGVAGPAQGRFLGGGGPRWAKPGCSCVWVGAARGRAGAVIRETNCLSITA